jgi:hypothetical protein
MTKPVLLAAVLVVLWSGCESKPPTTPSVPDTDGSGSFSGTINSVPWTASPDSVKAVRTAVANTQFVNVLIAGTDATLIAVNCTTRTLDVAATYDVASGAVICTVTQGPATWEASQTAFGSDGFLTFTTLTTSRAVGSYTFFAVPAANSSATGTKQIIGGVFDVRF